MSWLGSYLFGGTSEEQSSKTAVSGSGTTRLGDEDIAEIKEADDLPLDSEDRQAEIAWRAKQKAKQLKESAAIVAGAGEFRSLQKGTILGTAIGQLFKYEVKRDEFRPLLSGVKLVVLQDPNDAYYANLQFRKNDGSESLLLECMIASELELQFDFAAHRMRFNLFRNDERGGMDVLTFEFAERASEEHVSRVVAVKLFETNHRCMFSDLIKKGTVRDRDEQFLRDSLDTRTGTLSRSEAAALASVEEDEDEEDYLDYGDAMADVEYVDTKEFDSDVDMQDCTELFGRMTTSVTADGRDSGSDEESDYLDLESDEESRTTTKKKKTKGVCLDRTLAADESSSELLNQNLDIVGSKNFNRVFVTRKIGRSGRGFDSITGAIETDASVRTDDGDLDDCGGGIGSHYSSSVGQSTTHEQALMGYFRHSSEGNLEYNGKLRLHDQQGRDFIPYKMCGYRAGHEMLMLSEDDASKVHVLNLDRGAVVDTWDLSKCGGGSSMFSTDSGLEHLTPIEKHSDAVDLPQVYGVTNRSLIRLDGRTSEKDRVTEEKTYSEKTKTEFECLGTSSHGFVAVGSLDGHIRMYDSISKRAKVDLPGIGEEVKSVEVSSDSRWILATCQSCILLISTLVRDDKRESGYRTGFEGRGIPKKQRVKPIVLRLRDRDRIRIGVRRVEFTAAKFNESRDKGSLGAEKWIVSSVGNYVIKWNFTAVVKKGRVNDYSIRKAKDTIVKGQFRFGIDDDLLVSEKDNVYAQHSSK